MKTTLRIMLTLLFCIALFLCCAPATWADAGDFTLPANTTVIEDEAFLDCAWMKTVTIPAGVTRIGNAAFSGTGLTDVYFGGTQAQWATITIGSSNEKLTGATLHCIADSGTWGDNITWMLYSDGLLAISGEGNMADFSDSEMGLLDNAAWRRYISTIKSVKIKTGVTNIGSAAFLGCNGMTDISIPSSVVSIGNSAFYDCIRLTEVTIPAGVKRIDKAAFMNCSGLISISIPSSVTSIGSSTFYNCIGLTEVTIPKDMTDISNATFYGCTGLKSITISGGVTSIGNSAFSNCIALSDIYYIGTRTQWDQITKGTGNEVLVEATVHCQDAPVIVASGAWGNLTWTLDDWGLLTISGKGEMNGFLGFNPTDAWLQYRDAIKTAEIKEGVTNIGINAFMGCVNLTSVSIPTSVTSILNNEFIGCDSLKSIKVNVGNENYCDQDGILFENSMTCLICCPAGVRGKYTIPQGVTSIGAAAFKGCSKLTNVTIPESVTSIGYEAFYGCTSLTSVIIPKQVTYLGEGAFHSCISLTGVTILGSVTSIERVTFSDCTNLVEIVLPQSLTRIGSFSFQNCSSIETVTIPNGVTTIEWDAFLKCSALTEVSIPDSVTVIGSEAFGDCKSLTSITIPGNITSIGKKAFANCSSITGELIFPGSISSIGDYAFYGCKSLTGVMMQESAASVGEYAFYNCSGLLNVTIEGGATTIGVSAFERCSMLKSVLIQEGVVNIRSNAFQNCGSLTSVTVPGSVKSIGSSAFCNCSALTSATLEDGVTSIGGSAFSGCSAMTSVTIPESMESIGNYAFNKCSKLKDVYYTGSEEQWDTLQSSLGSSNTPLLTANKHYYSEGLEDYSFISSGVLRSGEGWSVCWEVLYNKPFANTIDDVFLNIYIHGNNGSGAPIALYSELEDATVMPWLASFQKTDFEKINIQGSVSTPLEVIADQFSGYSNVQTVQLTSVSSLQAGAFSECTSLETVRHDRFLTNVGKGAFRNDESLSAFIINSNISYLETINDEAFMNTGLRHFSFHSALKTIGKRAFLGTQLEYAVIHDNVNSIGENAFDRNITIYCYRDSEAHLYAEREGITCVLMDGTHDDTDDYFETTFTASSPNIGNASVRLKRGFDFINTDSSQPNDELALTAITLSAQVYKSAQGTKADGILSALGYDIVDFYNNVSTYKYPGVCFGYKQIENGKNLFAVVVRGTDTTNDITDIMTDLYDGSQSMFSDSSKNIEAQLEDFMETATGKTKAELQQEENYFFLTGHSLGGAIANCLSVNSNIMEFVGSAKGRIYTYTFESPHTCVNLWWTDPESESNALNYKVDGDLIPNLPPYMGSTTYGKDVWIKVENLNDNLFNELFPESLHKTLAVAINDVSAMHDVCLNLIYVEQYGH